MFTKKTEQHFLTKIQAFSLGKNLHFLRQEFFSKKLFKMVLNRFEYGFKVFNRLGS